MPTIYLIRHAEPAITGVLLGQMDPPLSETGKAQCVERLSLIHVNTVWTSPLQRAKQTAQYIKAEQIIEMTDLSEIDQGEWTGKTWKQIEEQWTDLSQQKMANWLALPAPGGEVWLSFLNRTRKAWKVIQAGPKPAAIVAHQGVNAAIAHLIDGRDPLAFTQAYGEVIPIEYD